MNTNSSQSINPRIVTNYLDSLSDEKKEGTRASLIEHSKELLRQFDPLIKEIKTSEYTNFFKTPERNDSDLQYSYGVKRSLVESFSRKNFIDDSFEGLSKEPIQYKELAVNIFHTLTNFFTGYDQQALKFHTKYQQLNAFVRNWRKEMSNHTFDRDLHARMEACIESVGNLNVFRLDFSKKDRVLRIVFLASVVVSVAGKIFCNKFLKYGGLTAAITALFLKVAYYIYGYVTCKQLQKSIKVDVDDAYYSIDLAETAIKKEERLRKNREEFEKIRAHSNWVANSSLPNYSPLTFCASDDIIINSQEDKEEVQFYSYQGKSSSAKQKAALQNHSQSYSSKQDPGNKFQFSKSHPLNFNDIKE